MFKLKTKEISIDDFNKEKVDINVFNTKINKPLKKLLVLVSSIYLKFNKFKVIKNKLPKDIYKKPCLILINHVNNLDLMIFLKMLNKFNYHIVTADEAFINRKNFLTKIGCYSVIRYEHSPIFVKRSYDIVNNLHRSIAIYPEAMFSSDGLGGDIAPQFSSFVKLLNIPVLYLRTYGVYSKTPLHNSINNKNKISSKLSILLTKEEVNKMSKEEIQDKLSNEFINLNYYQDHIDLGLEFNNNRHADHIERFLYKCPKCHNEFTIIGKGMSIKCSKCHNEYIINKDGTLTNTNNSNSLIKDIPTWVKYQKEELRKELKSNKYNIKDIHAYVYAYKNYKRLYKLPYEAVINVNKDYIKINMNNNEHLLDLRNAYDFCGKTTHYQFGPTLITRIGDVRYLFVLKDDNGVAYKIKTAVQENNKCLHSK